jgi:hypothetical protein
VNAPDQATVIHTLGAFLRNFRSEPAFEAMSKVFDAEELNGAVGGVGHEVHDPFGRDGLEEGGEVGRGVEGKGMVEERGHEGIVGNRDGQKKNPRSGGLRGFGI